MKIILIYISLGRGFFALSRKDLTKYVKVKSLFLLFICLSSCFVKGKISLWIQALFSIERIIVGCGIFSVLHNKCQKKLIAEIHVREDKLCVIMHKLCVSWCCC